MNTQSCVSFDTTNLTLYYDQFVTLKDILFDKKVKPTPTATELAAKITQFAKASPKQPSVRPGIFRAEPWRPR